METGYFLMAVLSNINAIQLHTWKYVKCYDEFGVTRFDMNLTASA
jgi:hypothetical protein